MLEPKQEGFRLVLVVDETTTTKRSQVQFGTRQSALFRIDNFQDSKSQKDLFLRC